MHSQWQRDQVILEKPKWWHFSRPIHFGLALAALIISVSLAWYFWTPDVIKEEDIPVIQAPPGPMRIKPDDPGGAEIPHQDKLIYDEFISTPQDNQTIKVRPDSEAPLELPKTDGNEQGLRPDGSFIDSTPISGLETSTEFEQNSPFEIVVAPKNPETVINLPVPEISNRAKGKSQKLRPLPPRKLYALKKPMPLSMRKRKSPSRAKRRVRIPSPPKRRFARNMRTPPRSLRKARRGIPRRQRA